jgi:hypothetical protein
MIVGRHAVHCLHLSLREDAPCCVHHVGGEAWLFHRPIEVRIKIRMYVFQLACKTPSICHNMLTITQPVRWLLRITVICKSGVPVMLQPQLPVQLSAPVLHPASALSVC